MTLNKPKIFQDIDNINTQLGDIPNQTYITEKAKTVDVNAALATKAEQSTTINLQSQINGIVLQGTSGDSTAEVAQARNDYTGASTFPTLSGHFNNIEKIIKEGISNIAFSDWELGSYSTVDGTATSSTTRIRTANYHILPDEIITLNVTSGYKVLGYYFTYADSTYTYVGHTGWQTSSFVLNSAYRYCKFIVADISDGSASVDFSNYFNLSYNYNSFASKEIKNNVIYIDKNFDWSSNLSMYSGKTLAIKYDYNLTGITVSLPSSCTLDFTYGGSFTLGTLVSPSNNDIMTAVKINIPAHKTQILFHTILSGTFYSPNKIYMTAFMGAYATEYNYCNVYRAFLTSFINTHIIIDYPNIMMNVAGSPTYIGKYNTIECEGNGVFAPYSEIYLYEGVTIKNTQYNSPSIIGIFLTEKCYIENVNFTNVNMNINGNYNKVYKNTFTVNTTDSNQIFPSIRIYGKHNDVKNNYFNLADSIPTSTNITLLQGADFNKIQDNELSGGTTGILLIPTLTDANCISKGSIKYNIISGNTVYNNTAESISLDCYTGNDSQSRNAFIVNGYVNANEVTVTFESSVDDSILFGYDSYVAFGLNDANAGIYSEIKSVTKDSNVYTLKTIHNIFTADMVNKKFGVTFGFLGNIIKNNIVYDGSISLTGCCFNNVISNNINYFEHYMSIYLLGGNSNYQYGRAYNIPNINNIICNNICPYGGVLAGWEIVAYGSTGNLTDETITHKSSIFTKVYGNTLGMYANCYGHYYSTFEGEGQISTGDASVANQNTYSKHNIKFTSYLESPNRANTVINSGEKILYLDSDGYLYLYNGGWKKIQDSLLTP